jgi:23S rRNA (uracil1939-C5)-methyltransferase
MESKNRHRAQGANDKIIEITIDSLAFGGEGVGRTAENMAVFVEGSVPGDRVKIRLGKSKKRFAVGYIEEIITPSPLRIQPRCKHFCRGVNLNCGGCSLQFLSYEDQLKIKEQNVRDAIHRIGGFDESLVKTIIGCAEPWYYRNKMDFSFYACSEAKCATQQTVCDSKHHTEAERRCNYDQVIFHPLSLGLHIRRRHYDLAEVTECFLMEPFIGEFVAQTRALFQNFEKENRLPKGMDLKSLIMRTGKNTGEFMINLTADNADTVAGPNHPDHPGRILLPEFVSVFKTHCLDFFAANKKNLVSVYFTDILNKKGQRNKITEHLLHGKSTIFETMQRPDGTELKFEISPQAFFQPNTNQAQILYGEALKAADLKGGENIFDLYCGAGTIGIFCANRAQKIYGIEINKDAVQNAIQNAKDNNIENIEFFCGDMEAEVKKLIDQKISPDVIILDPPRNGIEPKALEHIASFSAPKIVYISCNPTTQARDLLLFRKAGYELKSVQPVDMFPQTYHIESVALLEKI